MSKENQIEEMARDIACNIAWDEDEIPTVNCLETAKRLHLKNYRKASEIFAEIEKIIDKHYNNHIFGDNDLEDEEKDAVINFSDDVTYDIAELKKKYTEDGK